MKHENTQETYKKKLRNAVKCYVDSGERREWDWSQTQCSYLNSQDVFSKLCCQTEKASECQTGSYKNLTAATQWVLN